MTIEEAVWAKATAQGTALRTLVYSPKGPRLYPQAAPQDAALPYVVFDVSHTVPFTNVKGQPVGPRQSLFRFECFAAKGRDAKELAAAVEAALPPGDGGTFGGYRVPLVRHEGADDAMEPPAGSEERGTPSVSLALSVWWRAA